MEKETREKKEFQPPEIPTSIKILVGRLAFGVIKNPILKNLLDVETHHEFCNNITILQEFTKWFQHPETHILRSRDHVTVFRYILSVYLRAYHRNVKNQILLKLSRSGKVTVISQNGM